MPVSFSFAVSCIRSPGIALRYHNLKMYRICMKDIQKLLILGELC